MMKTEYAQSGGFLQRDSVEHKEYAEAYSTERTVQRKFKQSLQAAKASKGAGGVDGMTVD